LIWCRCTRLLPTYCMYQLVWSGFCAGLWSGAAAAATFSFWSTVPDCCCDYLPLLHYLLETACTSTACQLASLHRIRPFHSQTGPPFNLQFNSSSPPPSLPQEPKKRVHPKKELMKAGGSSCTSLRSVYPYLLPCYHTLESTSTSCSQFCLYLSTCPARTVPPN